MNRREVLNDIFKEIDPKEKKLIDPLIDEVIELEKNLEYYRSLPQINVNPKNPAQQRKTEAAKLRKECSQSYMNAIRILCSILHKVENNAQDELMKLLEEFKL